MYHLIYTSYAVRPFSDKELKDLLIEARANNFTNKITGMLIYLQQRFIQVLEGDKNKVMELLDVIRHDPRHNKVNIILEGNSRTRIFRNWSMGFKSLDTQKFTELSGYSDPQQFFSSHPATEQTHPVLLFLQIFYRKNYTDYPELAY